MWLINIIPDSIVHLIVLISISGLIFLPIISAVPFLTRWFPTFQAYKLLLRYVLIATLAFGVFLEGSLATDRLWQEKVHKIELENSRKETQQAEASVRVVTKTIEKIVEVKGETIEIIKKVPVYITKEIDSQCPVPESFNQLHDMAAKGQVSDAARLLDDAARTTDLYQDKN